MNWKDSKNEILATSKLEKMPPLLKIKALMFDLEWTELPADSTKWSKVFLKNGPRPDTFLTAVIRGVQIPCHEMTASPCKAMVMAVQEYYGIVLLVRKVPGKSVYERIGTLCSMYLAGQGILEMSEGTVRDITGAKLEEILLG